MAAAAQSGQEAPVVCQKATDHYEAHSTESYESAFFYSPGEYMVHLQKLVKEKLQVSESEPRRLMDVGAGTGNFTKLIIEGTKMDAVAADPFLVEQDHANDDEAKRSQRSLHFIKAPAEDFMKEFKDVVARPWWMQNYHQILFKEIIHHVAKADRAKVLRGCREGLVGMSSKEGAARPPAILIMTRPQKDIDYPMWPEARKVWAANQPSVEDICKDLQAAGFVNVQHKMIPFTCSCTLAKWQEMVKKRFWSTFIEFTDEQLAAGCEVIARERPVDAEGNISFDDRMIYITAEAQRDGEMEMKVSTKKSPGFYIKAAGNFLKGLEAREATEATDGKEAREALEAKAPVDVLTISGLGESINAAVAAATRAEAEGYGEITSIETSYPDMDSGRGCAHIKIVVKRK